jgi:hypothetical protein
MKKMWWRWVVLVGAAAVFTPALLAVIAARSAAATRGWAEAPAPAPSAGHAAVVAELFTSEGCSSCPPADVVLSTLVRDQPLPAVEIIGLGEHVDYWDHLGWRDPYSSAAFSKRQADYGARVFRSGDIYTPQLVIDGQYQAIGSDVAAVRQAIVRAATAPKASVALDVSARDPGRLAVRVRVAPQPGAALSGFGDIIVALVQDDLADDVVRGENRGQRLAHSAVVRSLSVAGSIQGASPSGDVSANVSIAPQWKTPATRLVAFLQERDSRRILGAATVRLDHTFMEDTR